MIKIPTDTGGRFSQPNNSDKFGSLAYTKNMNLDEEGYIKLSPRSVSIADEARNADFGIPVAIGRWSEGSYLVATSSDANFQIALGATATGTADEDEAATNPTCTQDSHAVWWQGAWHVSTATTVVSRPAATETWTSRITGLTSGVRHYLAVFGSYNSLCVSNANTIIRTTPALYTTAQTLTLPSDFEVIGMAYNNSKLGIITKLGGNNTYSQDAESMFFEWDGSTTSAQKGVGVGAGACVAIAPYKGSFAVLTKNGELLYWNGGGFEKLAAFPFYYQDKVLSSPLTNITLGTSMIPDGDVLYINIGLELNSFGLKQEVVLPNCQSGVWCYDPNIGLYHRWSPSISKMYNNAVTEANTNVATDVMTITSGTVPATGGIARMVNAGNTIGGLALNTDYYVIKTGSTTFKLATTLANAIAGTAIDLTSVSGGSQNNFLMFDLKDYGCTNYSQGSTGAGAIGKTEETNTRYQDILIGGDFSDTALSTNDSLCLVIPFLENRGYFVTPKIFSSQVTDSNQKIFVKFRPLKTSDSIIVKYRDRDIVGLPVTSSGDEAIWTSPSEFYTVQDLSEAKTYLDAGGDLECEFISGAGGGVMVKVTSISTDDTTYSVVLAEEVLGASATLKSEFIINNWKTLRTITSTDTDAINGVAVIPIGGKNKFAQFKVELRGYDTCIEELGFINDTEKQAK